MTDAQEQVLGELAERGPLTWFRLDALLSATGFQIGPTLFAEVDLLERDGYLVLGASPHGPKTYRITAKGERLARYLADVTWRHRAWLGGQPSATRAENWAWITPAEAGLCDTADPALGPRRAA
jgi:DNA-binding PadR family transcriptional regulator